MTDRLGDSGVVGSSDASLARTMTSGVRRFELVYREIGLGDRHHRLEIASSSPTGRGVASVSQTSPNRRSIRHGLPASIGAAEVTVGRNDRLRWRRLVVVGPDIRWTVERTRRGVAILAGPKEIMSAPKDSSSIRLDDALSNDQAALCVGLWAADVAETLAWWYWVQFL
jgi:hypothetical protein